MIGKLNKNALILSLSNNIWVAIVLRLDRYLKSVCVHVII
jgi:hypothetical protein